MRQRHRRFFVAALLVQSATMTFAQDDAWVGRRFMPKSGCREIISDREVAPDRVPVPYLATKVKRRMALGWTGMGQKNTGRSARRCSSCTAKKARPSNRTVGKRIPGEPSHVTRKATLTALKDFTEAIRLSPRTAGLYVKPGSHTKHGNGRANSTMLSGDYTEAIRLDPQYTEAYLSRARVWSETSKSRNAILDYDDVIALIPENAKAYVGRGNARAVKQNFPGAIRDFGEAIRIDPNNARHTIREACGSTSFRIMTKRSRT